MDAEKIELLKQSFAEIYAHKGDLEGRFYQHLFAADPETRELFCHGNFVRKEMMRAILANTVQLLNRPSAFRRLSRRLAAQHRQAGVSARQYRAGPEAMILAFRDILGPRFTPEVEAAWREAMEELVSCFAAAD
ncbi:globin domain-containing protein [Shimia sp.]|uniref:globin domain-containing protein n=1 Tax=Shimia sp. TaxID=1954381 RepID=UPI003563142A